MRMERFEQPVQQVLPVRNRIAEGQLFRLSETFFLFVIHSPGTESYSVCRKKEV
jgi:hypothetical protein